MAEITRLVLDVLKPHQPNALDFATTLAELCSGCRVKLTVTEVDKKTESTIVIVEGRDINFADLKSAIEKMGGSVHSIDEVEVTGNNSEQTNTLS